MLTLLIHLVRLLSILIGAVIDPLNSVSNVYPARGVGRFFGAKLHLNTLSIKNTVCYLVRIFDKSGYFFSFRRCFAC
jgi:hypothetical protein